MDEGVGPWSKDNWPTIPEIPVDFKPCDCVACRATRLLGMFKVAQPWTEREEKGIKLLRGGVSNPTKILPIPKTPQPRGAS